MNIKPSEQEFSEMSKQYSHIPLIYEMSGDFDTPVSLYVKIRDNSPYSFLLESALQSGSSGRYSFIGFDPRCILRCSAEKVLIDEDGSQHVESGDPVDILRKILNRYTIPKDENLPPFIGGLVGMFSYDSVRFYENIPDENEADFDLEDYILLLIDTVIVYDHYHHSIKLITVAESGTEPNTHYSAGCEKLKEISDLLKKAHTPVYKELIENRSEKLDISSNMTKSFFERCVETAKEYIVRGDIFQIVLSQRFSVSVSSDSFEIYRSLRSLNPSPYMFYFDFDGMVVTGSSPEVLVQCIDRIVMTRPLAGTRKRGHTQFEDRERAEELLNDEKERAEHLMLVDLGRNDLGRFCKYGSIRIPEFMGIERYSHVMHIVSEVTGQLDSAKDSFDVLRGAFPAGTVSGAPKIRAMEIIDELEQTRRGIYAGAVGYIDFHDNIDTCIAIRTLFIKDKTVYIQAGAGIVADSVPENEYFETIQKAQALIKAVAIAEGKSYDIGD